MAREKERELKERKSDPYEKMMESNQRKLENKMLEGKKSEMEKAIDNLGRQAIESEMKYGADHFNTQILMTFYNVTFTMKEFVNMMFAMKEAMSVLSQTLDIMDDVFDFIDELMTVDNKGRYSLMGRIKTQRKIRKFVRNNNNRMKVMFSLVKGYGKIANGMMSAMSSFDKKLKKRLNSGKDKKNDEVVSGYEAQAQKRLAQMRAEMKGEGGLEDGGSGSSGGLGGDTPKGESGGGSGDINIDDIV